MASAFADNVAGEMKMLRKVAIKLCRNLDMADDLVQETCVKAITKQHLFRPGTNLSAWLNTILRNCYFSSCRKAAWLVADPEGVIASAQLAPDDQSAALDARDAISHLALLPAIHVRALIASADGLSIDEMATAENVPTGTIKSRVHRGRAMLAGIIGEGRIS
jgi:RNA polymerase sigma-70 factor, ECF subfamily